MAILFKGGIENEVKVRCRERSSLLGRPSKKDERPKKEPTVGCNLEGGE